MTKKIRITWVQVMALLALFGILLGVVGTAWMSFLPSEPTSVNVSGEVSQ